MFEIIKSEGLYCVFKRDTIVAAFETLKEAKEAVEKYKKQLKTKGRTRR